MNTLEDAFIRPADVLSRTAHTDDVATGECHMGGFRLDDEPPASAKVATVIR